MSTKPEYIQTSVMITAKYHGPTDRRGSRYTAIIERDAERKYSHTVSYDYTLDSQANAVTAARACLEKHGFKLEINAASWNERRGEWIFLAS